MATSISPEILTIISLIFIVLLAFICIVIWRKQQSLNQRLTQSISLINDLYKHTQALQSTIDDTNKEKHKDSEYAQATQLFESQMQSMSVRLDKAENRLELFEEDDPQIRMYKKATELAAKGLSVDEIMDACQLPRAEVEVLKGLQRK